VVADQVGDLAVGVGKAFDRRLRMSWHSNVGTCPRGQDRAAAPTTQARGLVLGACKPMTAALEY
jgi:hypothetical protein